MTLTCISSILNSIHGPKSVIATTLARLTSESFTSENSFEKLLLANSIITADDFFNYGLTIEFMLKHGDLLVLPQQKATALVILHYLFNGEQLCFNPFAHVFVNALSKQSPKSVRMLCAILANLPATDSNQPQNSISVYGDFLKKTPKSVVFELENTPVEQMSDVKNFLTLFAKEDATMPLIEKTCISAIIPHSVPSQPKDSDTVAASIESIFPYLGKTINPTSFFVRVPPPLFLPSEEDDLIWINPLDSEHKFVFDDTVFNETSSTKDNDATSAQDNTISPALKSILELAFKTSLSQEQNKEMKAELAAVKNTACLRFCVDHLPDLVENNPITAVELLLKVLDSNGGEYQMLEFLKGLVNIQMSVHSMEVVNRLTNEVELPSEFIQMYISNCIQTCEGIPDKFHQNRLVRLLCVFLQSLIRNKIVNVSDLMVEVQAFCIEFSSIREAAALFRLMKSLDNTNTTSPNSSTTASNTSTNSENNKHNQTPNK